MESSLATIWIAPRRTRTIHAEPVAESGSTEPMPENLVAMLEAFHERSRPKEKPECASHLFRQRQRKSKVYDRNGRELKVSQFTVKPPISCPRYFMWVLYPADGPPKFVSCTMYSSHRTYYLGWLGYDAGFEDDFCAVRVWKDLHQDFEYDPEYWEKTPGLFTSPRRGQRGRRGTDSLLATLATPPSTDSSMSTDEMASIPSSSYGFRPLRRAGWRHVLQTDSSSPETSSGSDGDAGFGSGFRPINAWRKRPLEQPDSLLLTLRVPKLARIDRPSDAGENANIGEQRDSVQSHQPSPGEEGTDGLGIAEVNPDENTNETEPNVPKLEGYDSESDSEEHRSNKDGLEQASPNEDNIDCDEPGDNSHSTGSNLGAQAVNGSRSGEAGLEQTSPNEDSMDYDRPGDSSHNAGSNPGTQAVNGSNIAEASTDGGEHETETDGSEYEEDSSEESDSEEDGSAEGGSDESDSEEGSSDEEDTVPVNGITVASAVVSTSNGPMTPPSVGNGIQTSNDQSLMDVSAPHYSTIAGSSVTSGASLRSVTAARDSYTPGSLPAGPSFGTQATEASSVLVPSPTSRTTDRRVVFILVGRSDSAEERFTLKSERPGAELFERARGFFETQTVNVLYCLISPEGRRIRLNGSYLEDVDAEIDQLEATARITRLTVYVKREPF